MSGGASREKDTADFDLERFIEIFDEAMTSDDPRVKNALRQLMMMVILTDTSGDHEAKQRRSRGPLRQMHQDMYEVMRKMNRMEEEISRLQQVINGMQRYGEGYRVEGKTWPKEWGGPTWAVGSGVVTGGNIPPVTADDLNIKIGPYGTTSPVTGQMTGKK